MPETGLPRYKCHKEVRALKIASVHRASKFAPDAAVGRLFISPEDERFESVEVSEEYVEKHNPQVGGYYVVYEDGYKSYSPAKAFEEGYTLI